MEVRIFDVEHGGCALITADTGARIMIDCGYNRTTGWRPSKYLLDQHRSRGYHRASDVLLGISRPTLDYLFITNYDEDHVDDLPSLLANVNVKILVRNLSVAPETIKYLKSECGMGRGIEAMVAMARDYNNTDIAASFIPHLGDLSFQTYYNHYPAFDDENNLSVVTFFNYHGLRIVFPGDLEKAGWLELLRIDSFRQALNGVNVFVASHHGREGGYCPHVFDYCHPSIIIFSDKGIVHETQKTAALYAKHATGIDYFDRRRYVFTTRCDGVMLLRADQTGNVFFDTIT